MQWIKIFMETVDGKLIIDVKLWKEALRFLLLIEFGHGVDLI